MPVAFPCGICCKPVAVNHRAVLCDICGFWIHIKCNSISPSVYDLMTEESDLHWCCIKCINLNIPFSETPDEILKLTFQGKNPDFSPVLVSDKNDDFVALLNALEKVDFFNEIVDEPDPHVNNCLYYTLSEFNKIKSGVNSLSFFHLNIASLSLHFGELSTILVNSDTKFDFIGISETGLNTPSDNYELIGYKHIDCPTDSTKGGARLYFSDQFNYKRRDDLRIYESKQLESVFVEILSGQNEQNLIVGCVYKHPNLEVSDFNNYLHQLFEKISGEKKKIVLLGDFNIDLLKLDLHDDTSTYFDIVFSFGLLPTILRPTRITCRSTTLIDNIFSNFGDVATISGNLVCSISDHLPQFAMFDFTIDKRKEKSHKLVRSFKKFNRENFLLDFFEIDWNKEFVPNNPDLNLAKFITKTNELIDYHAPFKKVKFCETPKKPWITKGILTSISRKNALYKRFMKEKDAVKKEILSSNFKIYKNWLTKIMCMSKTLYFQNFFETYRTNLRETWKGIKSLVSSKARKPCAPSSLLIDKNVVNDPLTIANCFNDYFSKIATDTKAKIRPVDKNFSDYLGAPNESSIFLSPTNPLEIGKVIQSLQANKAEGPYSIPSNFLKLLSPTCSEIFSSIFNSCMNSGIYPSCLKTAKVIPVFKNDSALDPSNYRPISLLSNVNKIFEKILHSRLISFLEKYSCLYSLQFGFRKGLSTSHAVLYLTEQIRECTDKGGYACGVFLDLKKAFDTVEHSILLEKMSHYGIRGTANSLFKSYLCDRSQHVAINGIFSTKCMMQHGVPQGSVLGPLLFLIYINDLNLCIKHSKTVHFADDTSLLNCNHSLKKMNKQVNHDLRLLNEWLRANKICLNADKTEIILFRSSYKKLLDKSPAYRKTYKDISTEQKSLNFRISGQKIIPTTCVTYLGVKLNQFLNWDEHFATIIPKLSRANGMLAKMRHYVPRNTLFSIYHAIFNSHLNYCSLVWGKLPQYIMDKIRSLQNSALRLMYFKSRFESAVPLYHDSKILPFHHQITKTQCVFAFRQQIRDVPSMFSDFCKKVSVTHGLPTLASRQHELSLPQVNLVNQGINSVKFQVAKSWNWIIPLLLQKEKDLEKESIQGDKVKYKAKELHDFSISSFSEKVTDILLKFN